MSFIKKINIIVLTLSLTTVAIFSSTAAAYAEEQVEVSKLAKKSQQVKLTEEVVTEEEKIQEVEARIGPLIRYIITAAGVLIAGGKNYEKMSEVKLKTIVKNEYDLDENCWYGVCEDEEIRSYRLGSSNNYMYLTFGDPDKFGLTHILGKHTSEYWTGIFSWGKKHSFIPEERANPEEIEKIIKDVSHYNRGNINDIFKYGLDGKHTVTGYSDDVMYTLVVRDGNVTTLYPTDINRATYD
ncbi:hypothetical protein [uncultured Brevibacillus sp.]|uniref:hypothetical protein n=1 Tax=uncultured Brevibacillus sp. TaxID=169970 RepID=UPI0025922CC7|nr:hypothetical protein [uncultured Brevibacillus sp.]